ncbi:Zinc finger ZZ-type and EF-hand domain-containing protein 1 [Lonchura striata]|uniref:Zinc finger ZZ-type and EF-hand domain-containing protein 1 n=1 Tax=Lonchura striata TaxID=40157 RepID=A0A218V1F7_9PASE|nr:Zinc finger ZZ-type and EF-hand domain-containing protein 1 [Lonchura striata domestica]
MGTAASHSSEEEEEGAEEGMEGAAGAPQAAPLLPPAEVLLEQARLREATARLREAALPEPLVSRHHSALVRWLEERLSRGDEAVSLEQFCEVLESVSRLAAGSRGESEEAFAQFDAEGDGTVDVENMLEALKNSSGANLQGELSHVIRQLQACSLVPGFIDIFSESKERLGLHASMILRFLHRNRISSTAIPYPVLEYFNNICTMRSSVLKDSLDRLLLKEREYPSDLNGNQESDKLKSVMKCYTHIETSSNSADIDKMTNGETSSFWHLKMKPDVVLRHLSIAVAANDQSYMPQQVTVAVGRNASNLQEVRDVHIPSNITGYVTLLENANISQMYVQINIKRCLSDGCDTRIHGLRAVGYQRVKKVGVSVSDASAIWYWSLLTSLVTASMETNPAFVHTILQNTQKALQHMPPLSLTPGSTEFSSFLSPNVLEEVDSFLIRITSCCTTPEVELTLLAFALARGSVAKVLSSLCAITDHLDTPYKASSLISSMAAVRQNLLYKYGKPLRLTLQACDVKGKEDKSGPENLLVEPWTGDVTQIRLKVRRGAIGAQCGLVFAYNSASEKFHAEEHFKRFESYDKWKLREFKQFLKTRSSCSCDDLGDDDPIGWFEVEEEWDEVDVRMQQCRVSQVQQKESGLKYKSFLDFTGLDLQLFWNFYNKLHQNPREECIFAQTLLLQLLQSCFSVLTGDNKTAKPQETPQSKTAGHIEAAEELYRHLCEVVDMGDSNFMPMKMLKEEVKNTLLSGAAVFFPDRQTRRHQLFTMMGSLLSWCYLQLKGTDNSAKDLAVEILKNYVGQFLSNIRTILQSLLSQYSGKTIVEKISSSVFAMATRQLVIFLLDFCTLDIPYCTLLQGFSTLIEPLKSLCSEPHKTDMESWQQEQPVVLRTWTMESPHNYENNCHEVSVFLCHGATYFEVEFDEKCETERRYDYLEFTDARGAKTRYDTKVGTEKWPKKVTFKAGPRLQFLFHSDSSNNEWGYKFSVTAYGLPDVAVSWGLDLQLLVSRLMGRLASRSMALKSLRELGSEADLPPLKVTSVLNSPLWKPVFRHQLCPEALPGARQTSAKHQDKKEARSSPHDVCRNFLIDFAKSDPAQDFSGQKSELFKGLIQACKKQTPKTDIVAGPTVDQAVNSTFAALVYLTPDLFEKLQKYVNSGGKVPLSDEFAQVYSLADSIRIWMLEMKQKSLMGRGNDAEEKQNTEASEMNPETLAKLCVQKSLLLLNFLPIRAKTKDSASDSLEAQDMDDPQQYQEDVSSPPSTPTRKSQLSRGRLRLLSFRSMEEPKPVPTVKEKYPVLKNILDFIKDQSLSHESVLKVLALRKSQGQSIMEVLKTIRQCLDSLGQPHCFNPPCVLFLLELLACQKDFTNYFGNLEGCGAELHKEIRESYYQLVLFLVNSVKGFSTINDRSLLPALSCVQTALLHLLDMSWEPSDLSFFVEIQLPHLLMTTSQENISIHDSVICQWSEEDEIADYKQNCEWMDECQDVMFETWYEKIAQADPEKQRKMHMFVARYCDLLNVDISCNGCDEIAPWHRYRCLQCNDMDLCKTCFLGGVKPEGHEDDHEMVNMEYACDHCQGVIIGRRMNCNVCDDFDLCYGCYHAKKYSDSHLPTHSITVYPMVTIRISDRQRLIQPYVHNYSWLLFAALTLYSADLANGEEAEGEKLDPQVVSHARVLQHQCIQLIGDCLMKAQHGKGLKNLALLCMLPEDESTSENGSVSGSPPTDSAPKSHPGDRAGKGRDEKRSTGSLVHRSGKRDTRKEIQSPAEDKVGKQENEIKAVSAKEAVVRQESDLSVDGNAPATGDGSTVPEGWKTTHLLFSLGAVCLDSRVGLDWASSMADILRSLNASAQWHPVLAAFTDHCIKQLPFQLKHTNIFTLLVLVGFPEVLCMGTRSVYMDNANEPHNVIILKHFTEKNRAVVVDIKTRKRKTVKDYQLIQKCGQEGSDSHTQLRQYLQHFVLISTHLLQTSMDSSYAEAVETTWVLSLALKGLYRTLKIHGFKEIQSAFLQSGLLKLLVKKCSKGTGFSKTWLLRDLEQDISSLAEQEDTELEDREQDQDVEQPLVGPVDLEQNKLDPLEGLDEATKICFLMTHDALNAPLHILRAMYELQMKRTESFFLEVQKRFDGDVITTDERIRTLAQKWQPSKRLRLEEQSSKAVDTDMIILPCLSKPVLCDKATEETNPVAQKLITNTESDLQLSYAKQRRTKSSILLHKELDSRSKKAVRDYLYRVNEAIAVLYARHVLASLLAEWPDDVAINEEILDLSGPAHMTYILDMLMQLEEKQLWERILQKVLHGCKESMLGTMALTACQFMEEPGMAVQTRESRHPYNNNTNFEDKVHIPGAIYLSIKFDSQCNTEEGCDELLMSSSSDFQQDRHSFSGSPQKWTDFELPGDTLYYRFTSDMSNTEWGYKFTVTAGHLGRFQTGFEILKQMLSEERVIPHLPLAKIWEWQVGVACRQTGHQRLKAIHLLLKIVQCSSQGDCDLTLLKPLWQLFTHMENNSCHDSAKPGILLPLHRALAELFFVTENRVTELGSLQEYLLALNTEDHLHRCTAQALKNIAAISLAINYPNKSTSFWNV